MTFEEYAQKSLGDAGYSFQAMELVRMGWNARREYGEQAARAQGGQGAEAAAEVVSVYMGSDIIERGCRLPVGTMLYTQPQIAVPEKKEWDQATGRDGKQYTDGWNDCRWTMLSQSQEGE